MGAPAMPCTCMRQVIGSAISKISGTTAELRAMNEALAESSLAVLRIRIERECHRFRCSRAD